MTAKIIDGKRIAQGLRAELAKEVALLKEKRHHVGLDVILVGSDPASEIYVRNKVHACRDVGITSNVHHLPADTTQNDLLALIQRLNYDAMVDGILVQLPLPPHINEVEVIAAISPRKDVDGFHETNIGRLMIGDMIFAPCTPFGIMKLLQVCGIEVKGAHAVVVGAGNVGKPISIMLMQAGATVTVCHQHTRDLAEHTRRGDILVVAVGKPRMISAAMVKPGAVVIDVGINRLAEGGICGDVDFEPVREVAGWITPVPGGVGPMTIAMLLENTVISARSLAAEAAE
ncbi:MAG: bifunctional methylenetetrahydrofolate dehydrogenase/methenyltetrahydrofolate cyclohydrolase FolD [Nitrospirota bacterium]|nr:bifunctional methylenetetrahydrofolate dehydrogenase/methenyltetrahydrofolate cyclohydrolase FolD [Nitrospirota bacterium]